MHRRKTMVVQQSVELVLQCFNVALYLIPNVYSLVRRCVWADNLVGAQPGPLKLQFVSVHLQNGILPGSTVPATAGQFLRRDPVELVVHCEGMPSF